MLKDQDPLTEPRRRSRDADDAYLKLVGDRVRLERARRGLSRKALADSSGVSERYLADLERGAGNASLRVMRGLASALDMTVAELVSEEADRLVDVAFPMADPAGVTTQGYSGKTRDIATGIFPPGAAAGRLALIGLRGAGKTTVGTEAAKALGLPFVELDREIERATGLPLPKALAAHGPVAFRALECASLEAVLDAHDRAVIAAGGGIVTATETFDLLLANCRVIWLKASPEQHVSRAMRAGHLRSTARNRRVLDELRVVLDSRAPLYARAHEEIETTAKSKEEVVAAVVSIARRAA